MAYEVGLCKVKERLQIHLKAPQPAVTEGETFPIAQFFLNNRRGGPACPPVRTVHLFTLKDLIGHQILIERPRAHTWVIPLLGEMSQSDKRVAVVLRTPLRC